MDEPSDELVVPDVAEPIVAYRSWSGHPRSGLRGYGGALWVPDGVTEARCEPQRDYYDLYSGRKRSKPVCVSAPCPPSEVGEHMGHGCGLYATKADTAARYEQPDPEVPSTDEYGRYSVSGIVHLWGTYYEYSDGYRAQYGQVAAIYDSGPWCEELADLYGCDLLPWPCETVEERRTRLQQEAREQAERHAATIAPRPTPDPQTGAPATEQGDDAPAEPDDGLRVEWVNVPGYTHLLTWRIVDEQHGGKVVKRQSIPRYWREYTDVEKRHGQANAALVEVRYKRAHPLRKASVALLLAWPLVVIPANIFGVTLWNPVSIANAAALIAAPFFIRMTWRSRRT